MTEALRRFCPAKVNLHLRITGRRPDGYHTLETLFHAIDLGDDLYARQSSDGFALTIGADDARDALPVQDDNLVLRAARRFQGAHPQLRGASFHLHKRVPHGGGLGGGSSDAAAALHLCNELAGRPFDDARLCELGAGLGADVPFFVRAGTQWGVGTGVELSPCATAIDLRFTLLVPPFGCPTAQVYGMYAARWQPPSHVASIPRVRDGLQDLADALRGAIVNDLAAAAEMVRPELAQLRVRVEGLGVGPVAMSGSGSTLFVVAQDAARQEANQNRLAVLTADGVRVLSARSLPQTPATTATVWPRAAGAIDTGGGA